MTARWLLVLTPVLLPSGLARAQAEAPPDPENETKLLASDGAAATNNGFTKGPLLCNGTVVEIGEPFQLPPLWILLDGTGSGCGDLPLEPRRGPPYSGFGCSALATASSVATDLAGPGGGL